MEEICTGFRICLQATYLKFRNKFFRQIHGTAVGSPVSVVVANLVMEDVEERAIDSFGQPSRVWKRFVDDTFVILDKVAVDEFFIHLNQIQHSIEFTMEGEKDNCISCLDISITREDHAGTLDTNIYRKPTHSERYLNFKSEHLLEHKFAVVNTLTNRANSLIRDENKQQMELKRIQNVLTLNGYPNRPLNRKLKIKSDPLFDTPATHNAVETHGIAILSYVPKLSEKLKLILLSHGIRSVFKPPQKLGGLLCLFKDAVEAGYWQGVIYKKNCSDCDQCYIGETKRWFETRKKEHMRDVKNSDNNATALFKHTVELGHSIDWENYEIFLQIELTTINANSLNRFIQSRFLMF